MDLVMVRSRHSQSSGGGMVRDTWAEKGWGAHNGVRRDDVVEVRKPAMSEQ
jgi:hypothetical protein